MPRLKGTTDLLEDRRRRALALLDLGYSLNEVGRRIGCAAVSVMRWRDARQRGGESALQVRFSPGRPPKMDSQQRKHLPDLLLQESQRWTTARIARVIELQFGIRYHRDHVGKLMHSLQWGPYEPKRPALQRDERGVPRYNPKDLEALKNKPRGWAPIKSISISSSSPRL